MFVPRHGPEVETGSSRSDGFPLPQNISFSAATPSLDSTVVTLSGDIVHTFFEKKLTFVGKNFSHKQTSFDMLITSTFCYFRFRFFSNGLSDWPRSHCVIFPVKYSSSLWDYNPI